MASSSNKGIAILFVLWVLTLLSIIAGEFCYTMRTELKITSNFKEETQGYYIALAGYYKAIFELIKKEDDTNIKNTSNKDDENNIEWRINSDLPFISFESGIFKVRIENESGKININKAQGGTLKLLLKNFDISDKEKDIIVDSILDWRDKDNLHRINGAEDDYYQTVLTPYECKDDDFDSIEELLLVRGVTSALFCELKDIITVYGDSSPVININQPQNKGFDYNKININAAHRELLSCLPGITDEKVEEILEFRKSKDFKNFAELFSILGSEYYTSVTPYITFDLLPYYTIISQGNITNSKAKGQVRVLIKINKAIDEKFKVVQWYS
ncbi:MAG: general secretion pathway protein GspK [Desulfobacterales bacterium]|nr:general secretion pathway protein GspK [Desulfobacterales bacterium]